MNDQPREVPATPPVRPRGPVRVVATIAVKDLRQQLRSGTVLVFAVVLPLGMAFLFHTIVGDTGGLDTSYAVVDRDGGEAAVAFTDGVLGPVADEVGFDLRSVDSVAEGERLAEAGEVAASFVIPAGFSADVAAGRVATLTVIGDVDSPVGSALAAELARAYTTELESVRVAVATGSAADPSADPAALAQRVASTAPPVSLVTDDSAVTRQLDNGTYFAAGMSVFFLFFTAMLSVNGLLLERSQGTMARLLAAPTRARTIMVGKLVSTFGVGLAAMAVLVGSSTVLLGADWGHPLAVAALVVAVAATATGLSAALATLARKAEHAGSWMSAIAVLLGLFGGSFMPLSQFGDLAWISYLTPHRWFLQGLSDLAAGDPGVVLTPVAALLGFAAVLLALALTRTARVVRP